MVPIGVTARAAFHLRNCKMPSEDITIRETFIRIPNAEEWRINPQIKISEPIVVSPNPPTPDYRFFEILFTPTRVNRIEFSQNRTIGFNVLVNGLGSNTAGAEIFIVAESVDPRTGPLPPVSMSLSASPSNLTLVKRGQFPKAVVEVKNNSFTVLYGLTVRLAAARFSPAAFGGAFRLFPQGSTKQDRYIWEGITFDVGEAKKFDLVYLGGVGESRTVVEVLPDNQPRAVFAFDEVVGRDDSAIPDIE